MFMIPRIIYVSIRQVSFNSVLILLLGIFCQTSDSMIGSCHAEGFTKSYNGKSYAVYRVDLEHQRLELWARDDSATAFEMRVGLSLLLQHRASI